MRKYKPIEDYEILFTKCGFLCQAPIDTQNIVEHLNENKPEKT